MLRVRDLKAPSKTEDLLQYGAIAARTLKEIAEATGVPCLKSIAGLTTLIIQTVQNTEAELPPDMVRNIEQFQDTLQKLLSYHALDVFGVQSHVITAVTLAEMQEHASRRHQEVMDALSSKQAALPPGTTLEDLRRSSSTLSLLPALPLIFTGRDKEQKEIITIIQNNTAARIVVLGPGGIGKTSLTLSVLHDYNIVDIFGTRRYFISCDAASTKDGLVSTIAKYFNLEEKPKLSNAIIHYLNRSKEPALMVLDNFETPWEIPEQRSKVEDFLSLLANISHLSIVLTMRGVERPGKIRWTRPFLAPLQPLTDDVAEEIFRDIADIDHDDPDLMELLMLTDNLPLAVTLMAHLAESETCTNILSRWKQENTSLLSDGVDKISSLEKSISMSISSPRMKNTPDALELLSLLALLPDGISEATLLQMKLPFDNVPKCRFILVSTSLAYVDGRGRVKALTPIREYTRTYHPPRNDSLQSVNAYVNHILDVWTAYYEYPSQNQINAISDELGNIYSIIGYNLQVDQNFSNQDFQTVKSMISLLRFMEQTAIGSVDFILSLSPIIKQLGNKTLLQGHILYRLSNLSQRYITFRDAEKDLQEAYGCFENVGAYNEQALSFALLDSGYINDALHLLQGPETLSRATGNLKCEFTCINIRIRAFTRLGSLNTISVEKSWRSFIKHSARNIFVIHCFTQWFYTI
ncbi:P-loop containing nucleoside triphosphate hydrolase protein [Crucibulum laeve]|uniref:P-loop containing nucleoside triphosphate hydrolase protein n=1 Tax=Crucibulum laeve TaxID=68775 RepID=A0A5C3LIL3_9AGAR|nr:P-loop containing nucleoside triphosphate hydrolase protein [Crucibulum laeve]